MSDELLQPTELRIEGLRTIERLRLPLNGLTVLIGDNGTGKSSVLEALEILRRAGASGPNFFNEFNAIHGGRANLFRMGTDTLTLSMNLKSANFTATYQMSLGRDAEILERLIVVGPTSDQMVVFDREGTTCEFFEQSEETKIIDIAPSQLALTAHGVMPPREVIRQVGVSLAAIQVHVPFDVTPEWAARSTQRQSLLRNSVLFEQAGRLDRFGANLANVYASLRNEYSDAHWQETMDYVRLGLGYDVELVTTHAELGGGRVALGLKYRNLDRSLPAVALSEGTLAYLAFVALFRLDAQTSLLAFDEPDLHLHPELLMRVVGLAETMAKKRPVIFATHSDRLLDGLRDPLGTVLFELDKNRATVAKRPDAEQLAGWLERYRGIGDLRAEGYGRLVMTNPEDPST